jgi:DNA-binding GntR family transcriptional regulator
VQDDRPVRMIVSQAENAYRELRDLLLTGALPPGDRLSELALAERLGTSRTPVREALRRLEADGLVVGSGRGVAVPELERSEVEHAFEVRATLEAMTAQRAARRVGAGQVPVAALDELRRLASVSASATARGELAAAISANREFHRAIAELAGNSLALDILDRLWDRLTVSARISLEPARRRREVNNEHDRLVAAIASGDAGEAGPLARAHVEATLESLADALKPTSQGRRRGR